MRNEMMHRPVLKDEVLDLVRDRQRKTDRSITPIYPQNRLHQP